MGFNFSFFINIFGVIVLVVGIVFLVLSFINDEETNFILSILVLIIGGVLLMNLFLDNWDNHFYINISAKNFYESPLN